MFVSLVLFCVVVCVVTLSFAPQNSIRPPRRECVECASLCLQPNVGVVGEHFGRHVPRNRHDGGIARLRLSKLGDGMVPQIMEPEGGKTRSGPHIVPRRAPARLRAGRIEMRGFTRGEDVMLGSNLAERLCELPGLSLEHFKWAHGDSSKAIRHGALFGPN